jgi:hypothetical protein
MFSLTCLFPRSTFLVLLKKCVVESHASSSSASSGTGAYTDDSTSAHRVMSCEICCLQKDKAERFDLLGKTLCILAGG